jgi:hypothetical protein
MARARLNRILWAILITLMVGVPPASAITNPDEIVVYVPAFEGEGALGRNVATILNLQLWHTFRRYPWPNNPQNHDFGQATIIWSDKSLDSPRHDSAIQKAKQINILAQIVLWGKAYLYGDGIVVQTNLSLPEYDDFRERRLEVWRIDVDNQSLAVDIPRRRFEFSSIILSPDFVANYSVPTALKIYPQRRGGEPIGAVGDKFVGLQAEPDLAKVRSGSVTGWVRLPQFSKNKTEVIDMTAAIVRIYRGDWEGAITALNRVIDNSAVRSHVRLDTYLYRGMAKERLGESGREDFEQAYAISPYAKVTVQYLIMSDIARLARVRADSDEANRLRERIRETEVRHRYLFSPQDPWLDQLDRFLQAR